MKLYRLLLAAFIAVLLLSGCSAKDTAYAPKVDNGTIDLADWDFPNRNIQLNGEWEFYWQKLLAYDDIHDNKLKPDLLAKVPKVWNSYKINGKNLPGYGTATYRLRIKNAEVGQIFAINMPTVSTSYNLYINDRLIASNGKVGLDKQHFIPEYRPVTVDFTIPSKDFDIILQVANFSYARGGAWYAIYIGSVQRIADYDRAIVYKDMFLIGAFVIMMFYYISTFFICREDKSSLYFVFLCMIAIARTAIYGDYSISRIFPWVGYHIIVVINYVTVIWYPVVLVLFVGELFAEQTSRTLKKLFTIYAALMSLFAILSPIHIYTSLMRPVEAVTFAIMIYAVICAAKAYNKVKVDSAMIMAGALTSVLGSVHDILYQNDVIISRFGELSSFGFLILLFLQSIILAKRFKESMNKARASELAFLQAQIKPHFLYNALNTFVSISRYDVDKARNLIIEFGNYLRGSFDFRDVSELVPLKREVELVRAYIEIEKARFEERLEVVFDLPEDLEVKIPILMLQPIVENAVIHGILTKPEGGCIDICIRRDERTLHVKVKDNGIGMDEEKSKQIFIDEKSSGVGLSNIQKRLRKLYGCGLEIISKPNIGTEVNIRIPQKRGD